MALVLPPQQLLVGVSVTLLPSHPSLQPTSLGKRRRRRNQLHQSPLSGTTCDAEERSPIVYKSNVVVVDI